MKLTEIPKQREKMNEYSFIPLQGAFPAVKKKSTCSGGTSLAHYPQNAVYKIFLKSGLKPRPVPRLRLDPFHITDFFNHPSTRQQAEYPIADSLATGIATAKHFRGTARTAPRSRNQSG